MIGSAIFSLLVMLIVFLTPFFRIRATCGNKGPGPDIRDRLKQ